MLLRILVVIGMAAFFLWPAPSSAAVCTASFSGLSFGAVDTLSLSETTGSANVDIDCTDVEADTVTICIYLGAGSGGSSGATRFLTSGTSQLGYGLFKDAGHVAAWGDNDATLGTAQRIIFSANSDVATGNATIYGKMAAEQASAAVGTYLSTLDNSSARIAYAEGTSLDCDSPGGAQEATGSLAVSAAVEPNCNIVTHDLDFGITGIIDHDLAADTTLEVTCTPGSRFSIGMGNGENHDGSSRRMRDGDKLVTYGLFHGPSGTSPWGALSGVNTVDDTAETSNNNRTVYGTVPRQPALPGLYSDTVVVTITYE